MDGMALPTFSVHKSSDDRWFVETDWYIPVSPTSSMTLQLQVTSGGRLDTASRGWKTRDKAEDAIEQCKRRLR